MATAKKVPVEALIELTLTKTEAQAVLDVCQRIGGDPTTTRRGIFDGVAKALRAEGIRASETEDTVKVGDSLWFK